ncbi:MAG: mechanosensitive ion channel family protein [Planctomycetota bacterium]
MLIEIVAALAVVLQDGAPASTGTTELRATDERVAVDDAIVDGDVERRLERILASTGRYPTVEVSVANGVVFLDGTVADVEAQNWVTGLAQRTEGVVAVLDRLELEKGPLLDLAPATAEVRSLWHGVVAALPRVGAGLIALLLVALVVSRLVRWIARPLTRRIDSELVRAVVTKLAAIGVWLLALYVFLRVSGLTQVAVTVVGGTGVLGIVLGFAFRDIAENFLASVLISLQKPFRYGDTIEVDGHIGVVQRVTPRGTILMDFEGNFIQIANATVYKSTIKNFTANPNVRQDFVVGIGYDSSVARAQEIVMGVLQAHSAVLGEPRPMVLVEQLGSATVVIRVYFWVDGTKHSQLKVRSAVIRQVLGALAAEGISMPDDAREVVFPMGVPVQIVREAEKEGEARDELTPEPRRAEPSSAPARSTEAKPVAEANLHERHAESTDAEGGLASEVDTLNEQVRRARQPEEGADVMAGDAK